MPACNEEKRIGETLKAYCEYFSCWDINPVEIIVAINNTTDSTENIVKDFEAEYPLLSHITLPGKGKGYAIIEGWRAALKDSLAIHDDFYIGFVDADNATSPEAFADLIVQLYTHKNEGLDGAIASRYVTGAVVNPRQTLQRIFVSRIFNVMIRGLLFLNYRDTQCGAKLFRREAVDYTLNDLGLTQWAFDADLLFQMKRQGFKVKECPTVWSDKAYSKINFMHAGPNMALAIIRLRLLYSPFKFIVRAYDIIMKKVRTCLNYLNNCLNF